jgi:multisubunit Na+/H+ antiporter MnhE subunit
MPGLFFFWLIFPVMLAFQSLFTAVIVATGVKLYGKLGKFEVSSEEKPEHTVASDHQ